MSISDFFSKYKTPAIAVGITLGVLIVGMIIIRRRNAASEEGGSVFSYGIYALIIVLAGVGGYFIYDAVTGDPTKSVVLTTINNASGFLTPQPSSTPLVNWGMEFWMYVEDWSTGYGQKKNVLVRTVGPSLRADVAAPSVPNVYLHPTENTLIVEVATQPSESGPTPANQTGSSSSDTFSCEIPNIPLQAWTAVSISCSASTLDVYINGQLVKSCQSPRPPLPIPVDGGKIGLKQTPTFNGQVTDLSTYTRPLTPSDAQSFYTAGTSAASSYPVVKGTYQVKLGVVDPTGKEIRKFVL